MKSMIKVGVRGQFMLCCRRELEVTENNGWLLTE
jgi:hypothetical protein